MERLFSNKKISKSKKDVMGYICVGCGDTCYGTCKSCTGCTSCTGCSVTCIAACRSYNT